MAAGAEGALEKKCGKQANQNGLSTSELKKKKSQPLDIQRDTHTLEGAVRGAGGCSLSVLQIENEYEAEHLRLLCVYLLLIQHTHTAGSQKTTCYCNKKCGIIASLNPIYALHYIFHFQQ